MNDLLALPQTDPTLLYRQRDSMLAVDLMAAAIVHLRVFSQFGGGSLDLPAVCKKFDIHPRPTDVMTTLFCAQGLLRREGDKLALTELAREHLVEGSKWDLSAYYGAMKNRPQTLDMVKVLRTGKPANWGSYDHQEWIKAMERPDFAKQFTAAMDCRGVRLAASLAPRLDLSKQKNLLDVAGGSGVYACAIAAANPHVRCSVLERSPVDQIARDAIASRGSTERVSVLTADMLTSDWPTGFDAHLLSNVLHDWDEPVVADLLARSARALPNGGLVIIHDAFLNEDKTGPLDVAEYSALLMNICEGRCYSLAEMRAYLSAAGFEWVAHVPSALGRSAVVARKVA